MVDTFSGPNRTSWTEPALAAWLTAGGTRHLRVVGQLGDALRNAPIEAGIHCETAPVVSHGRIELRRYLEAQSLWVDYHRHGTLGEREGEPRAPAR